MTTDKKTVDKMIIDKTEKKTLEKMPACAMFLDILTYRLANNLAKNPSVNMSSS